MVVTNYVLQKNICGIRRLRIALVADLHDRPYEKVIKAIREARPDMIAIAGDLMCGERHEVTRPSEQENAIAFLAEAAALAPTFYALGNHETFTDENGCFADVGPIEETGAILLDDSAVVWSGMNIGGLSSPNVHFPIPSNNQERPLNDQEQKWNEQSLHPNIQDLQSYEQDLQQNPRDLQPNLRWLQEYDRMDGFKILLCHQPEYYPKYLQSTSIDIILSGHAHGGQWRICGRGVFAPGQGFFPKLTSGVHDDRLVISRGLANTARIPRICNETELVILDVVGKE